MNTTVTVKERPLGEIKQCMETSIDGNPIMAMTSAELLAQLPKLSALTRWQMHDICIRAAYFQKIGLGEVPMEKQEELGKLYKLKIKLVFEAMRRGYFERKDAQNHVPDAV